MSHMHVWTDDIVVAIIYRIQPSRICATNPIPANRHCVKPSLWVTGNILRLEVRHIEVGHGVVHKSCQTAIFTVFYHVHDTLDESRRECNNQTLVDIKAILLSCKENIKRTTDVRFISNCETLEHVHDVFFTFTCQFPSELLLLSYINVHNQPLSNKA